MLRILIGAKVFPHHWLAVVWVVGAPHANFITGVNHRCANVGHLHQRHQTLLCIVGGTGLAGVVRIAFLLAIFLVVDAIGILCHARHAVGVMAVHQVHHGVSAFRGVRQAQFSQRAVQRGGRDLVGAIDDPVHQRLCEFVIHDGIECFAVQPLVRALPNFTGDVRIRIDAPNVLAPLVPERKWNFVGNIKTPSINAIARIAIPIRVHPAPSDFKEMLADGFGGESVLRILAKHG